MATARRQWWKTIGVPGLTSSFEVHALHSERIPSENVELVCHDADYKCTQMLLINFVDRNLSSSKIQERKIDTSTKYKSDEKKNDVLLPGAPRVLQRSREVSWTPMSTCRSTPDVCLHVEETCGSHSQALPYYVQIFWTDTRNDDQDSLWDLWQLRLQSNDRLDASTQLMTPVTEKIMSDNNLRRWRSWKSEETASRHKTCASPWQPSMSTVKVSNAKVLDTSLLVVVREVMTGEDMDMVVASGSICAI